MSEARIDILRLPGILVDAYPICVHLSLMTLKARHRQTFQRNQPLSDLALNQRDPPKEGAMSWGIFIHLLAYCG